MSNMLKKVRKNANSYNTLFNEEMYSNVLGSLIITHYIIHLLKTGEKLDATEINKKWKSLRKNGRIGDKVLDFWIDDSDFIPKALDLFDMEPSYGDFCMAQSAFNTLFLPYIDGDVLPIREDFILPKSATCGHVYPIVEKTTEETTDVTDKQRT